jgi:hypothetical protein
MNDLLIQAIVSVSVAPVAYLILKLIFKKSIMFTSVGTSYCSCFFKAGLSIMKV